MSSFAKGLGQVCRQIGQAVERAGAALQGAGSEIGNTGLKRKRTGIDPRLSSSGNFIYQDLHRFAVPRHKTLQQFGGSGPSVEQAGFVAPSASLIGQISLGKGSSIWYNAVLRGDVNEISIGEDTNVQDGTVIHVAKNNAGGRSLPTIIGDKVTIGHNAVLHATTVEDNSLVGMGATLLDGSKVSRGAILAAGAVLTPNKTVPSGQIWAGNPAKYLRDLDEEEADFIIQSAENYAALAAVHSAENSKTFEEVEVDKARRYDRQVRDPDYDAHLGLERDPITREITRSSGST